MSDATPTTPAQSSAQSPAPTPNYSTAPAFDAGGGPNLKIILFALVVLIPIALVGYVYYTSLATGQIRELPDGYKLVNLKAMSTFPFDQRTGTAADIPEPYRALDGQKVQMDGEMFADKVAADTIKDFSLVYSVSECCFNGPPKIQHFVFSSADPAVRFYADPVTARGTLHIDVTSSGGKVDQVFRMDVESVEPVN